jgi:hypothetical protein
VLAEDLKRPIQETKCFLESRNLFVVVLIAGQVFQRCFRGHQYLVVFLIAKHGADDAPHAA